MTPGAVTAVHPERVAGDPRAVRPALRLALALLWLCALYWVVLPRLP